jgi:AcrR family transcriptional regulator
MSSPGQEQHILQVAKELFTKRGFANVAMRDICRAADVTPPTIYYYFKNKEALFDAVVRETVTMSEFINRLEEESGKAHGYEGKIRAFTNIYLTYFPKNMLNVGLYVRNSTQLDSVGKNTLSNELTRIQSVLLELIQKGIDAGEFRDTDPRMAAECLLGMMHRFIFQQIHFQRSYDSSEATSYLVDFFLRAMKQEHKP